MEQPEGAEEVLPEERAGPPQLSWTGGKAGDALGQTLLVPESVFPEKYTYIVSGLA